MLTITKDDRRDPGEGQYRVELVEIEVGAGGNDRPGNRFGYWCDKGHLRHMIHEVLEPFRYEFIDAIVNADPSFFVAAKTSPKVHRVTWGEDAVNGALSTLLDYRDGNVLALPRDSRPVQVAIDALRTALGDEVPF